MLKILSFISFLLFSFDALSSSFYSGVGLGDSSGKIASYKLNDEKAFSFSVGAKFDIPLFPIRSEIEYIRLRAKEEGQSEVLNKGFGVNTYVSIPLLPVLVPYVGLGLSYMRTNFDDYVKDKYYKSDWEIIPQYMFGFDLDLPTVFLASSIEYRYIKSKFDFDEIGKMKSKYHVFLVKTRIKF